MQMTMPVPDNSAAIRDKHFFNDTAAIDPQQWVNKYKQHLYRFALGRLKDKSQAGDLVQETFLAAFEKVKTFEGKSSEKTWLTGILKNKIIDSYRRKNTVAAFDQQSYENLPGLCYNNVEDFIMSREINSVLQKGMATLPALWSSVFRMKYINDLSAESICDELNLSRSSYWTINHRARITLRNYLKSPLELGE